LTSTDNLNHKIYRIIDANINRAREALRVIEDIIRFILNKNEYLEEVKKLRHEFTIIINETFQLDELLRARDVETDNGKKLTFDSEKYKKNYKDILVANFKRLEEALRVIEEMSKLLENNKSNDFKKFRFKIYDIEKKLLLEFK